VHALALAFAVYSPTRAIKLYTQQHTLAEKEKPLVYIQHTNLYKPVSPYACLCEAPLTRGLPRGFIIF